MDARIEGMEQFIGRRIKDDAGKLDPNGGYFVTRPDDIGPSTHINMFVHYDSNRIITDFTGNKCYAQNRGLYSRAATVREGKFTAKDIAYLKRFIASITDEV